MSASITIRVPNETRELLEAKASESGFKNLSAYARYVLEQSLDTVAPPCDGTTPDTDPQPTHTNPFTFRQPGRDRPVLQRPAPIPFKPNTLKTND